MKGGAYDYDGGQFDGCLLEIAISLSANTPFIGADEYDGPHFSFISKERVGPSSEYFITTEGGISYNGKSYNGW